MPAATGICGFRMPRDRILAEVREVHHGYRTKAGEVPALGPLDLTVGAGEFLVVVGPSGSGKSTLLRLLAGFEDDLDGVADLHVRGA